MRSSVDCILPSWPAGTSSGLISVSSTACSTATVAALSSPAEMTQRIRCWMRVFGTPGFTE